MNKPLKIDGLVNHLLKMVSKDIQGSIAIELQVGH